MENNNTRAFKRVCLPAACVIRQSPVATVISPRSLALSQAIVGLSAAPMVNTTSSAVASCVCSLVQGCWRWVEGRDSRGGECGVSMHWSVLECGTGGRSITDTMSGYNVMLTAASK